MKELASIDSLLESPAKLVELPQIDAHRTRIDLGV
jgi:hypothetical protein